MLFLITQSITNEIEIEANSKEEALEIASQETDRWNTQFDDYIVEEI